MLRSEWVIMGRGLTTALLPKALQHLPLRQSVATSGCRDEDAWSNKFIASLACRQQTMLCQRLTQMQVCKLITHVRRRQHLRRDPRLYLAT